MHRAVKCRHAYLLCMMILLQSCASSGSLYDARSQFYSGQPQAALDTLNNEKVSSRNQLLAYLDHGLIAHTAGNYQESIDAFKSARELLNRIDFIGVREQGASLITNDWVISYKGEYSERLWIHTFQMMNFLLLNQYESAAVEARQALQVYAEHGDTLKNDWYTRALMAMSFEQAGKADSAHIEYKKLINDSGRDTGIARRAWQNARRLGREQDATKFKNLISTSASVGDNKGELVLFLQTGSIPRKIAGEIYVDPELFASFPVYPDIPRPDIQFTAVKNGETVAADMVTTQLVDISRSALAARGKKIALKQALRIAAKKELARALEKRADGFGGLITAAMLITEQADTRSWETLPAHISMVQIPLPEGTHNITLQVRDGSRVFDVTVSNIDIGANKVTYRSLRLGSGAPRLISSVASETSKALPTP